MIRAFGADDVASLTPAKFRKLRFLMIANTESSISMPLEEPFLEYESVKAG
jgi:hypothetical protein